MSKKSLVPLQLPADPVNTLEAATKQYTDINHRIYASKTAIDTATAGWTGLVDGCTAVAVDTGKVWKRVSGAWIGTYTTIVCTSSTRPTLGSSQTGQMIVETDTLRIYMWTGTAWYYVTGGTDVTYADVYKSGTMATIVGTAVVILYDTEIADYGNCHASGVYTCPTAGAYDVRARLSFTGITAADRVIFLVSRNGAESKRGDDMAPYASVVAYQVNAIITCAAGDLLRIHAYQVAGTARTSESGSGASWATFRRVSG